MIGKGKGKGLGIFLVITVGLVVQCGGLQVIPSTERMEVGEKNETYLEPQMGPDPPAVPSGPKMVPGREATAESSNHESKMTSDQVITPTRAPSQPQPVPVPDGEGPVGHVSFGEAVAGHGNGAEEDLPLHDESNMRHFPTTTTERSVGHVDTEAHGVHDDSEHFTTTTTERSVGHVDTEAHAVHGETGHFTTTTTERSVGHNGTDELAVHHGSGPLNETMELGVGGNETLVVTQKLVPFPVKPGTHQDGGNGSDPHHANSTKPTEQGEDKVGTNNSTSRGPLHYASINDGGVHKTLIAMPRPETKREDYTFLNNYVDEHEVDTSTTKELLYLEMEYAYVPRETFWSNNRFECNKRGMLVPSRYLQRKYDECRRIHQSVSPQCTQNCQMAITMLLGERRTPEFRLFKQYFELTLPRNVQDIAIGHVKLCFDHYGQNEEDFLDENCWGPQKFLVCVKEVSQKLYC